MNGFVRSTAFLLLMVCASSLSHAAALENGVTTVRSPGSSMPTLVAPVLWMLGAIGVPVDDPAPLPNSEPLDREQGWRDLSFPVRDAGNGVYLEVSGRVEFNRATVRFADGTELEQSLAGAVRGRGLYLVADFGRMTNVETVVLHARSRRAESRVGVRLGR